MNELNTATIAGRIKREHIIIRDMVELVEPNIIK